MCQQRGAKFFNQIFRKREKLADSFPGENTVGRQMAARAEVRRMVGGKNHMPSHRLYILAYCYQYALYFSHKNARRNRDISSIFNDLK